MKKVLMTLFAALALVVAQAQVSSEPSENIDPADTVKIIVNLDQLDLSKDYVQNLIADADAGLGIFFWTWLPAEHPAGHPLVNGIGGAPWKNSNPALEMTKEANHIYSFTMVPTDFYEVDAATVYSKDIHFLVKPQDGGGYGDPDRKSDDLVLKIDPPATERAPVFQFPSKAGQDDIITIVYENWRETKPSMQNLDADSAYVHAECTLLDSTVIKLPAKYFDNPADYPQAKMTEVEPGVFELLMIPEDYFGLQPGDEIDEILIIVRKPLWNAGKERVDDDMVITIKCP